LLLGLAGETAQAGPPEEKARQRQVEIERLRAQNKALQDLLRQREQQILELTRKHDQARQEAAALAAERDLALNRVQNLLVRVRELEKAKAVAGAARGPDRANPPPGQVKGLVQKVTAGPKDTTLVQISIGSDTGLAVGHTLEVYRLEPRPEYLGMIRVVNVAAGSAVGQLVRSPRGGKHVELRPGDHVASSIQP
jgi:hypothetical protein